MMSPTSTFTTVSGVSFPAVDFDGTQRVLAALPPDPAGSGLTTWKAAGKKIVDEKDYVEFDRSNPLAKILDQGQHGCHDEATEVLTEKGWKLWSEYNGTDLLGTMNQETGRLEFQAPLDVYEYDYDGDLYYSKNRSVDFALTPNHRMYVRKWNERARTLDDRYHFQDVSKVGWYCGLPHATTGWLGVDLHEVSVGSSLPLSGDDFVALLALILSDGWVGGTENTWNRVSFCCFREDRIEMVRELAKRLGIEEAPMRPGVWVWNDPSFADWLRANAYTEPTYRAPYKRVPDIIKSVSQRQIELFLRFFGDQSYSRETRIFWTSSKRLADDIQELLLRVGKRGTLCERDPRDAVMKDGREIKAENCHPEYSVLERVADRLSLERRHHIECRPYKGKVYCARVPNSTLVTRRNGTLLISGNSCVGHGSCTGYTNAFLKAGGKRNDFSPCWVYGLGNGGRDAGMVISQALKILRDTGICLESEVPEGMIWQRDYPRSAWETAKRFRIEDAYECESFEDCCSAVQLGYNIVFGILVGGGFTNLDSEGVPGVGGNGGHCLTDGNGMKRSSRWGWLIKTQNSWSARYGLGGYCWLSKHHFDYGGYLDAFAIRVVTHDPEEEDDTPSIEA